MTPYSPSHILIHTGEGGGREGELAREKVREVIIVQKAGRKYPYD
jgi:hypothetical protein